VSATLPDTEAGAAPEALAGPAVKPMSPNQRAWARFRRNRLGYVSLWLFAVLLSLATFAEFVSNDRPFVVRVNGEWYFPAIKNPSEVKLGGDFHTPTDWKDPFIAELMARSGNWSNGPINPHSANSTD